MDYKKMLFELLVPINNEKFLACVYTFVYRFKENWRL